ncbi:hypothetical protein WME98_45305 [Sorangium sp. So ce296]|uniref:hypothetical protein n=1 Tax=Sorangium sp. So ce296 TaxID=3133296 RepID=UPI003F619E47
MTAPVNDRLYALLPYVYRFRDAQRGHPLRTLLRVIEEQASVIERDLDRLYDNWFIETCDDWVVPYLGDLVGFRAVASAGEPGEVQGAEGMLLRRTLAPRSDIARTLAQRRRKGTLPLLEELARMVAGWPAHAVELYRQLSYTQPIRHQRLERGRTIDLRDGAALEALGGAFGAAAHTADIRRPTSARGRGRHNIPSVGVFVWRLRAWPVTRCQAYLHENIGRGGLGCFSFNVLGDDTPLFVRPEAEPDAHTLSEPWHVPAPLTRGMLERDKARYYGEHRSLCIWLDRDGQGLAPVPAARIVAADLTDWRYRVPADAVLVDPELGRFKVAGEVRKARVSFHYGFSAAIGGGEYDRDLIGPAEAHRCYVVGEGPGQCATLRDALSRWRADTAKRRDDPAIPPRSIIEVATRGAQTGRVTIELPAGETLVLRAADRSRPVIRLLDEEADRADSMHVRGERGSRFVLDGLLVAGRGVDVRGPLEQVVIRHTTLLPAGRSEEPREGGPGASLVLDGVAGDVRIERSILGPVIVSSHGEAASVEPARVEIVGSVVDAGHDGDEAVSDGEGRIARAALTVRTTTVLGRVMAHAIALAENSIFSGEVQVARRQPGCMRFCYVPEGSRTPRRYHCQPDLALEAVKGEAERRLAAQRVRPVWTSRSYGDPAYVQLWRDVAREIARGADDEGEMGALHDLYLPQREDALAARLSEYVPAGTEAGIFFVT